MLFHRQLNMAAMSDIVGTSPHGGDSRTARAFASILQDIHDANGSSAMLEPPKCYNAYNSYNRRF